MSVRGIGVDLVETSRIDRALERFGERFLHRVFTEGEIAYCHSMKYPARHLAARFAAKEAVSKALGTGIGRQMGWRDIEVQRKESGEPFVCLTGGADRYSAGQGICRISVSLTHTEHHAIAMVVLES